MEESGTLVLIGIAAFILPAVAGQMRIPAVVAEILFGVAVGPVLGLVSGSEMLDQIGGLGLLMLMFLAGFEVDFEAIRRGGSRPVVQAFLLFFGTLGLSFIAVRALALPIFYVPLLATTSAALVFPSLRAAGIITGRFGQAILVAAVLADVVTLLLVAEITIWTRDGWSISLIGGPLLVAAAALALRVGRLLLWWHPQWFERLFRRDDPEEMGIRGAFALLLVFAGISAALHIEPILAAFLAGGAFALLFRPPETLRHQLSGISWGFLIPIFFINVGVRFDIAALADRTVLARAAVIVALAFLVKFLPAAVLLFWGYSLRAASAAGVLLSARLSLVVAVATVGVSVGLLNEQDRAIAVLIAAVTSLVCPTLFRLLLPRPGSGAGDVAAGAGPDGGSGAPGSPGRSPVPA